MPTQADPEQRPSTVEIAAAYVTGNATPATHVPALINTIHRALVAAPVRARTNGRRRRSL